MTRAEKILVMLRYPVSVLLFLLFVTGCVAIQGRLEDGRYHTPDGSFSVAIPNIPRLGLEDGGSGARRFVDFFSGPGYWYPHGQYSVEWIHLEKTVTSPRAFLAMAEEFVKPYLAQNYGGSFRIMSSTRSMVSGRPAWRFVALGSVEARPAVWVGTLLDFHDTLVAVNLIYPVDTAQLQQLSPSSNVYPQAAYQAFVNSIQRHGTP